MFFTSLGHGGFAAHPRRRQAARRADGRLCLTVIDRDAYSLTIDLFPGFGTSTRDPTMALVFTINGSPSPTSRTAALLGDVVRQLLAEGHEVESLNVRDLPAVELIHAKADAPEIAAAVAGIAKADGIVVATPIYKAAYSGLLKVFLDLLPQYAFEQKTVLPLATGGSFAHLLALDYGLRPVLSSLGARHIVGSYFVLDKTIRVLPTGAVEVDSEIQVKYRAAIDAFTDSLHRHAHHV
jgi:FMN reductase